MRDADFVQLMWLASPALPVGGFSYSEGLESLVQCPRTATESIAFEDLVTAVKDQLQLGLARGDLPTLALAIAAWRAGDMAEVDRLNAWVLSTRETQELRLQAEQMGRSLLQWLRQHNTASHDQLEACAGLAPAPSYPITYALAVAATQASVRAGLVAHCFGWAENMAQAAIKAVPLGQTAGQRLLQGLVAAIPAAVDAALACLPQDRQAFLPRLAILSAQHETQYSRLFRS
jgi:urease accessory protein